MHNAILVGAGGMGKAWARNLRASGVRIVAWVDVRPGAARDATGELELEGVQADLLLSEAIKLPGIDFVVDVTAPEGHCEVTLTALKAGLPVIGEKPMATTIENARRMVEASEEAGKLYMVSQSRRYDCNISAFRRLIEEHVGALSILNADFYRGPHFGGFREDMASPLLLDMAIHTFDQARFISGCNPISVYAEEFNSPWSWFKGDACANASFEMSGGLHFNYRGSWCTNGLDTSWQGEWRACGPRGTAKWDGDRGPSAELGTNEADRKVLSPTVPEIKGGIEGSLAEFLWALETGETPNGECHDNIKSLAMVFAAVESAKLGRRVNLADFIEA